MSTKPTDAEVKNTDLESKISKEARDLAAKLADKLSFKSGKLVIAEKAYLEHLPEDMSVEMIEKVHNYNSTFFPAVTLAAGRMVNAHLKEDESVKELTLNVPLWHKDSLKVGFERSHEYSKPKTDEKVTKYCVTSFELVTRSAEANRGDMQKVRDFLADEAFKAFGK